MFVLDPQASTRFMGRAITSLPATLSASATALRVLKVSGTISAIGADKLTLRN